MFHVLLAGWVTEYVGGRRLLVPSSIYYDKSRLFPSLARMLPSLVVEVPPSDYLPFGTP
jgi:hypothetical protein